MPLEVVHTSWIARVDLSTGLCLGLAIDAALRQPRVPEVISMAARLDIERIEAD